MLYLWIIKDKYIEIYNEFILQLWIYAKAVKILVRGYLPISLVTPLKEALIKTNPEYDIVIKGYTYITTWNWLPLELIEKKSYYTIPNFHATLYTTTVNIILIRNSSSSNCRLKH